MMFVRNLLPPPHRHRLFHQATRLHQLFSSTAMSSHPSKPQVHGIFHAGTSTMTYIISDPSSTESIILDSVLDYDAASGRTSNTHNQAVVEYCSVNHLDVKYILESHVHGMLVLHHYLVL
jgi:glyoxylase-like metal-dependent hydrolase (beta-lactamase superfamily II)